MDNNIIRIAYKGYLRRALAQPFIKNIMQKQIGQQRADYATLWSSLTVLGNDDPIRLLYRTLQPAPDVGLYPLLRHMALQGFHEQLMVYFIKESFDVHIHYPAIQPYISAYGRHCIMGAFQGTVPIGLVHKLRLKTRLQIILYHLLGYPVCYCGNAKGALPPIRLRNLYGSNCLGKIAARGKPVP